MIYKIRVISKPGHFVRGTPGYYSYDKSGRVFQTLGRLRAFLHSRINDYGGDVMSDWEVVAYEMTELKVQLVSDVVSPEQLLKTLAK